MTRKLIAGILLLASQVSFAQSQDMRKLIDSEFQFAAKQYKVLDKNIPAGLTPQSFNAKTNKLVTYDIKWWCSGFLQWFALVYFRTNQRR